MEKSRRDFIAGSAAAGVVGVTEASAQPARRTMPPDAKIGVLHTTTFGNDGQEKAFLQALKDNGVIRNPGDIARRVALGNYANLDRFAKQLINLPVDLIVAAGGLVSAVAVAQALQNSTSDIPFIYLIGHYPRSGEGYDIFRNSRNRLGGVNQENPSQNEWNWQWLQPGNNAIDRQNVALIVNNNAAMTDYEKRVWDDAGGHADNSVIALEGPNGETSLNLLFQDIATRRLTTTGERPLGLVVSADSYFRSVGTRFDQRLRATNDGNFTGWVCYPYGDYARSGGTGPDSYYVISSPETIPPLASSDPALSTRDETYKNAAYYQLGLVAAAAVKNQTVPGVMWNGTAWVPQTPVPAPSRPAVQRRRR
jgi:hypothetical protein